jgi:hypothetical protein
MRTRFLCLAAALAVIAPSASTQWVQTAGIPGGIIQALAVVPHGTNGEYFFGGDLGGGVYLSADNGTSWTAANNGLTNPNIQSLAAASEVNGGMNIFAGTWGSGVFRSTNYGASWFPASAGLTDTTVFALAIAGTNVFAGTMARGVFRSTNYGTTWTAVDSGLTNMWVMSLAVDGTNLFAGTWGSGLFVSTDNGTSWTAVSAGITCVSSILAMGGKLFASSSIDNGVFVSTDNGTTWTHRLTNTSVMALASRGENIFAGAETDGMYRSTDNGMSWNPVDSGLSCGYTNALAVYGTTILAGTRAGVYRSMTDGAVWEPAYNGIACAQVYCFCTRDSTLYAGTSGGGVFKSTNNGTSWAAINHGLTIPISGGSTLPLVNALAYSTHGSGGIELFVGVAYGWVYHSTDDGASWAPVSKPPKTPAVWSILVNDTKVYAGTGNGIFFSTNSGASWSEVDSGLTSRSVNTLAMSDMSLFAGTSRGGFFRSTNNGTTWTPFNNGLNEGFPEMTTYSLVAGSNGHGGTTLFAGTYQGGVFRVALDDSAALWEPANKGLPSGSANLIVAKPNGTGGTDLFVAMYDALFNSVGAYFSSNNGDSWTDIGLSKTTINSIGVNDKYLFVVTYGAGPGIDAGSSVWTTGVWRRLVTEVTGITQQLTSEIPLRFSLEQNYPNPFNPATEIGMRIAKGGFVSLKVFDVLGRQVATLVNQVKHPGTYTVTWDASGVATGVYFYRLHAGSFVDVKKMLLVR